MELDTFTGVIAQHQSVLCMSADKLPQDCLDPARQCRIADSPIERMALGLNLRSPQNDGFVLAPTFGSTHCTSRFLYLRLLQPIERRIASDNYRVGVTAFFHEHIPYLLIQYTDSTRITGAVDPLDFLQTKKIHGTDRSNAQRAGGFEYGSLATRSTGCYHQRRAQLGQPPLEQTDWTEHPASVLGEQLCCTFQTMFCHQFAIIQPHVGDRFGQLNAATRR
ncbi:hypothetical protein B8W70_08615 [Pseudomonas sp. 1239]|nr:hypothetical protein B8W70_08615 [Pseudomonas sp. 1239]